MKRRSLALGAIALAALVLSATAPVARAGWWDDLDKGKRVRLGDLIAQPVLIDGPITFTCVYHGQDNVFFPYFTHFTPEKHLNLTVWPDGQPVWEKDAFTNDFPFLYVTRDHAQRDELVRLPIFTRIEVTGRIRDIYRRAPWIELLGFRKTGGTLGERVVQAMMFGDQHQSDGESAKAYASYRQALDDASLDEGYALRVRKRLGNLLRNLGREEEANEVEGGKILGGTDVPKVDKPPESPGSLTPSSQLPGTETPGSTLAPPPSPSTSPEARPSVSPGAISSDLPGTPVDAVPTPAAPAAPKPLDPVDPFAPPPFVEVPATLTGLPPPTPTGVTPPPTPTGAIPPPTPDGTLPPPTPTGTVGPIPNLNLKPAPPWPSPPSSPPPPPKRVPRLSGVR